MMEDLKVRTSEENNFSVTPSASLDAADPSTPASPMRVNQMQVVDLERNMLQV
jgi:hypothetical protein